MRWKQTYNEEKGQIVESAADPSCQIQQCGQAGLIVFGKQFSQTLSRKAHMVWWYTWQDAVAEGLQQYASPVRTAP